MAISLSLTAGFLPSSLTSSLSTNVDLNNTSLFFDGPTVAQGTLGTWYACGTVTMMDPTGGGVTYAAKLWDGTTIIASGDNFTGTAGVSVPITLSGLITNPAGNLRISVSDLSSTSGEILANVGQGNTASTITAIRLA